MADITDLIDRCKVFADAARELEAMQKNQFARNEIASQLQYWLDWHAKGWSADQLNDSLHVMGPPTWPTRGALKNWISVLQRSPSSSPTEQSE